MLESEKEFLLPLTQKHGTWFHSRGSICQPGCVGSNNKWLCAFMPQIQFTREARYVSLQHDSVKVCIDSWIVQPLDQSLINRPFRTFTGVFRDLLPTTKCLVAVYKRYQPIQSSRSPSSFSYFTIMSLGRTCSKCITMYFLQATIYSLMPLYQPFTLEPRSLLSVCWKCGVVYHATMVVADTALVGLGTWLSKPDEVRKAVLCALQAGKLAKALS